MLMKLDAGSFRDNKGSCGFYIYIPIASVYAYKYTLAFMKMALVTR